MVSLVLVLVRRENGPCFASWVGCVGRVVSKVQLTRVHSSGSGPRPCFKAAGVQVSASLPHSPFPMWTVKWWVARGKRASARRVPCVGPASKQNLLNLQQPPPALQQTHPQTRPPCRPSSMPSCTRMPLPRRPATPATPAARSKFVPPRCAHERRPQRAPPPTVTAKVSQMMRSWAPEPRAGE